jgi:hypothetical protein
MQLLSDDSVKSTPSVCFLPDHMKYQQNTVAFYEYVSFLENDIESYSVSSPHLT